MELPVEFGEITAQRTLRWLDGWKKTKAAEEVPIFGGG
jgi:hypothetical protein